jgi:predicted ester cyclase
MADDAANYRRIPLEIFNEGKLDVIDEVVAEDFVEHMDLPPGVAPNRESFTEFVKGFRGAFPDLRYELLQEYQDGDKHIAYVRVTGTMSGEFEGMPPSGKSATWDEVHIGRMANGELAEHWGIVDRMSMMQQLGFIPGPGG